MAHRRIFTATPEHAIDLAAERRMYLDTGVIRRRGRTLIGSPLATVAYTSALAVIELLAGIGRSEREFRVRQAAIKALLDSEVVIDWQMPDVKTVCSFPQLKQTVDIFEYRCVNLIELVSILLRSVNFAAFARQASRTDLEYPFEYFVSLDQQIGESHAQLANSWKHQSRQLFEHPSKPEMLKALGLPENLSYREFLLSLRGSQRAFHAMLHSITVSVCRARGIRDGTELFHSYDHSVDLYLEAVSWWDFDELLGHVPSHNDAIDLAHFVYFDRDTILVTTDKRFATRAAAVGVEIVGSDSVIVGA